MRNEIEIIVRGYHLDMFSHVNNARYLEFLEEARWATLEGGHFTPEHLAQKGWTLAVVNINIDYKYSAGFGSILKIVTVPKSIGNKSVVWNQKIYLKGTDTLVVDADITFVVIDSKTAKAIQITDEIKKFIEGEN